MISTILIIPVIVIITVYCINVSRICSRTKKRVKRLSKCKR